MNNTVLIGRLTRDPELKHTANTGNAMAERDYRVALQKEMLKLREEGIPVTIINDLARGNEDVADLKIARDVSDTLYQTALQYIYATKINIEIVQQQMDAERKGV